MITELSLMLLVQSLTELVVLDRLKQDGLPIENWAITAPRKRFFPRTQAKKLAMVQEELARMLKAAEETGEEVDSVHLRGESLEQWKLGEPPKPVASSA